MTADDLLKLLDVVRKSVGFTLRNPTGVFVIKELAADMEQTEIKGPDGDWTCWRGDQIVIDNQLTIGQKIKFSNPEVFGLAEATIPAKTKAIVTVSDASPSVETGFSIGEEDEYDAGGGGQSIIVQPPPVGHN